VIGRNGQPDWREELQASASKLEAMNGSTEQDFLTIANKLAGFRSAAKNISSLARSLSESIGDRRGAGACQFLVELRDAAQRMATHVNPAAELERIRDSVALIQRSLLGFERVGPSFHVIATLAQRESAHIGTEGMELGHLVHDFRSAGGSIQSHVEGVLDAAAVLERRIDSALHDAATFNDRFSTKLPALIGAAEVGLADFRAQQEQSVTNAGDLAHQSEAVAAAIADIVTSIQFHDITRQQIEHVFDSLKELAAEPAGDSGYGAPHAGVAAAIDLQVAQLANSRAVFVDAIEQMDRRLDTVAVQINAMAAAAGALLGRRDHRDVSFYSRIVNCFHAISDAASDCKSLEQKTERALGDVDQSLKGLEEATSDIDTVESRLKRLAINAVISAGQIGATGEPLRALAMEMLKLVKECETSSGEVQTAISSVAGSVRAALEKSQDPDIEAMNQLFEQLRREIDDLHDLDEAAASQSGELAHRAGDLCTEVQGLRKGITAGRVFTSAVDASCTALRRISLTAEPGTTTIARDFLMQFKERYTMNTERGVHAAILAPGAPVAEEMAFVAPAASEFGDNVELF
jgi:methyl-accepting chemotaxis protein